MKTELLHPVDKGGRIRSYHMLRALARQHAVTYLCLDDGKAAFDAHERAREYCTDLVTVPFSPTSKTSPALLLDLLRNFFSRLPYAVARYRSARLAAEVARLAPSVDVLICDFLFPSQNIAANLAIPTVLFQHNVEAMIWQRHAAVPQNALRRAFMREQWRRMLTFERAECRRFDRVVAVSTTDVELMRREYGVTSIGSVDTGVDLEYFVPPASRAAGPLELVFVGSMDWMPNDDGVRWFIKEVFGRLRAELPQSRLTVVGRSPTAGLRELALRHPGVEVTGTVPDVRPFLARGTVCVVPLRIGGGTRLKIYEAMAMGIPIVSTTIGAEGLPVRDGEHLLIADSPEAQAVALIEIARDSELRDRLSAASLAFVRAHCSWDAVAAEFMAECLEARDARAARAVGADGVVRGQNRELADVRFRS